MPVFHVVYYLPTDTDRASPQLWDRVEADDSQAAYYLVRSQIHAQYPGASIRIILIK